MEFKGMKISLPGTLENRDRYMLNQLLEHLRQVRDDPSRLGEFFELYVDEGFAEWQEQPKTAEADYDEDDAHDDGCRGMGCYA